MYQILETRKDSFKVLIEALDSTYQSGACEILRQVQGKEEWVEVGEIQYNKNTIIGKGSRNTNVFLGKTKQRPDAAIKIVQITSPEKDFGLREIKILKELQAHSNIVQFYRSEIVQEKLSKHIFLAVERCSHTLEYCVKHNNFPLPKQEIIKQATSGLQYLHGMDILHRDIKPANVLLAVPDNQKKSFTLVKLSDFGLSKIISKQNEASTLSLGTVHWTPAEIIQYLDDRDANIPGAKLVSVNF